MKYEMIRLADHPERKVETAQWFHEKWGIPLEAYLESMEACLAQKAPVPQWYTAVEEGRITGGLGVRGEKHGSLVRPMAARRTGQDI